MAEITAANVKNLRDRTGAGMMDAKAALVEASGDVEMAIEILRKKGQAKATKKAEAAAKAKAEREASKATKAAAKAALDEARKTHNHAAHAEVRRRGDELRASCLCACGCGQVVPRAVFCPGHDSRLASRLLAALAAGATDAEVRALVVEAVPAPAVVG